MADYMNTGAALSWGDDFHADNSSTTGYRLLKPGNGHAVIRGNAQRGHFGGSERMSACPCATVTMDVTDAEGATNRERVKLYLNTKTLFRLTSFAKAIGDAPADLADGQPFRINWDNLDGRFCYVVIGHHVWTGNDGQPRTSNDITAFLYGDRATAAAREMNPETATVKPYGGSFV